MTVRMEHPELPGQPYDATEGQVPHLRSAGWQVAEGQPGQGETWPAEALPFGGQPMVRLYHPELDREVDVPESAVPIHRSSGWQLVQPEAEAALPDDLDGLTVADLQALLRARGLPVSGTKAELVGRLRAQPAEEEPAGEPAPEDEEA